MPDSSPNPACLNCRQPVTGNFCANCGQDLKEIRRPFFYLLKDALRAVFELDSRAWLTLYFLFTRPGFLSREYVSGRRVSYTPPLRLFLVISISYFLLVSAFASFQSMRAVMSAPELPATTETAQPAPVDDTGDEADFDDFIDNFSIPFLSDTQNENLRRYMRSQAESKLDDLRENPTGFIFDSLDYITIFILLMMPILALIQKLLYLRSRRFYVEHLILTLHNHSFLLLAIFLINATRLVEETAIIGISQVLGFVGDVILFWIVIYLFLSLRNFFEQGFALTLAKFAATIVIYSVVTAIGIFYFAAILFFLF